MVTLYPKVIYGGIIVFYQNQRRNIMVFLGLIILLIAIGFSYGYITHLAAIRPPHPSPNPDKEDLTQEPIDSNQFVQEASKTETDSVLVLERFYIRCQHTVIDEMIIDTSNVGKTGQDLNNVYPTWTLMEFTPERVMFTMDIDGYCPRHYIIMEKDDYLVIYGSEAETGNIYPFEETNIKFEGLSQDMKEQVRYGLVVDSKEDLEHLIENWES